MFLTSLPTAFWHFLSQVPPWLSKSGAILVILLILGPYEHSRLGSFVYSSEAHSLSEPRERFYRFTLPVHETGHQPPRHVHRLHSNFIKGPWIHDITRKAKHSLGTIAPSDATIMGSSLQVFLTREWLLRSRTCHLKYLSWSSPIYLGVSWFSEDKSGRIHHFEALALPAMRTFSVPRTNYITSSVELASTPSQSLSAMTLHSIEDEKIIAQVEHVEVTADEDGVPMSEQREQAEKRLVRLLDMRLLPTIIFIFLMNYTDVSLWLKMTGCLTCSMKRNALTAARVEGLQEDLHLTGTQCSTSTWQMVFS